MKKYLLFGFHTTIMCLSLLIMIMAFCAFGDCFIQSVTTLNHVAIVGCIFYSIVMFLISSVCIYSAEKWVNILQKDF